MERILLRRLAVFAGGSTLEAAETVCADDGLDSVDVLDLLTHLVDKSLVAVEATEDAVRYRMLETVRQYAREKLLDSGDGEAGRSRHLGFFVAFAESKGRILDGEEIAQVHNALEADHDNLRAAIDWAVESGAIGDGLRLMAALRIFWFAHGHYHEGRNDWSRHWHTPEQPNARPRAPVRCMRRHTWRSDRAMQQQPVKPRGGARNRHIQNYTTP